MLSKHKAILFLVALLLGTICGDAEAAADQKPLKVGFVYTGSASDLGWNQAHDLGRQYLEKEMHGSVVTARAENVPENASCERVMEKMIAQGNTVIIATSYGFLEPVIRVAKRHPNVKFMHCGRMVPGGSTNVGSYFCSNYWETMYAAGVVAGKMTKTNKLGYVGGQPIPALFCCMNAFALGAQSANPKVRMQVVWINSWEDPAMEAEAAKGLLERGCDVLASSLNTSMTVCKSAENGKAFSVGTNLALQSQVQKGWLTGQSWNWGPMYFKIVQSVQDNSWKPENLRYGLKDGYAVLAPFGKAVPASVQAQALQAMEAVKQGKKQTFAGPLKDREGKLRLVANQKPDQMWLETMDWFVPGIDGSVPKR